MITQTLEILIIEDNEKQLADARAISSQYKNINFSYAVNFNEAERLVTEKKYDAVVTDVFFPINTGEEPTSDSALNIAKLIDSKSIPFVFNTSGNHHGCKYQKFLEKSRKIWNNCGLGIGKMIEAYPHEAHLEKDTKQWNAAINYAVLLAKSKELSEDVKGIIGELIYFTPYGDYGQLSKKFNEVLDPKNSIENLCTNSYETINLPWSRKAFYKGTGEIKLRGDWNRKKQSYNSRDDVENNWFIQSELEFKEQYVETLNFIRNTLSEYTM
jgi:hypothetical protein